jgi:iron(III) transport system permease protein
VLLRMWENGQAEAVSVIGLMMMLLVFVFRWVQLRLIKRYISTL